MLKWLDTREAIDRAIADIGAMKVGGMGFNDGFLLAARERKAGMQTVTVNRTELLDKLVANRAEHRSLFLKGQENYRVAVIERLDKMLADARNGVRVAQHVGLIAPEDHTKDYDLVIAMLNMSVGDTIEISQTEFRQYVMDEWQWARQFGSTVASYGISNKMFNPDSEG